MKGGNQSAFDELRELTHWQTEYHSACWCNYEYCL